MGLIIINSLRPKALIGNMSDKEFLKKRINELSDRAREKYMYTFTEFLSPQELSDAYLSVTDIKNVFSSGGYEEAERKMLGFGDTSELGYDISFPLDILLIEPVQKKFSDELGHRDFLGALMNLGIKREKLGDILVKENSAYLICKEDISDYIISELSFVKHTHIRLKRIDELPEDVRPNLVDREIIVSNNRIDAIVAKLFNLSREQSLNLFREKKVYVNSAVYENNSGRLKENDIVSVRGHGKFIFIKEGGMTRKERLYVLVRVYS